MSKERPVDPGCSDPVSPETCHVQSPLPFRRIADPCGDVVLPDPCVVDPTKFSAVTDPGNVAATAIALLPSITIQNAGVTRTCAQLPGAGVGIQGASVTLAAGALTRVVPLSRIPGVTEAQREKIVTLDAGVIASIPTLSANTVALTLGLTMDQAEALLALCAAAQTAVNDQAVASALAALDCYYVNTQQTANCSADAQGVAADAGTLTSTVAAGVVVSRISVAAANAEALTLANSQLRCQWNNTNTTATCANGASGAVTGSYTVAANTLQSSVSRADANTQAAALAQSRLDCRYGNTQQTVSCASGAELREGSNPITVSANTVFSTVSTGDANVLAQAAGQGLLTCRWLNVQVVATCPTDAGQSASVAASPVYQVTVTAGTFASTVSQNDANEQATNYANLQLDCRYCNTQVAPLCTGGGSDDETAEVPANTFCDRTYAAAQQVAAAFAAIPIKVKVTGTPTCRYLNDRVTGTCGPAAGITGTHVIKVENATGLSPNSSGPVIVEAGSVVSTVSKADANSQAEALALSFLDCFYDNEAEDYECPDDLDDMAPSPDATSPFTIPAGAFRSYASRTEANQLRDAYALASLNCFYDSEVKEFECDPDPASNPVSPRATQPFTVPAKQFRSSVSVAEANALRDAFGESQLNCFWENEAEEFACDPDPANNPVSSRATQPFTVEAGVFTSAVSVAEANALRDSYGNSLKDCFFDSTAENFACDPDPADNAVSPQATQPFTLVAGQFTSNLSVAAADQLRDAYGNSLLRCFFDSTSATFSCPVGSSTRATQPFTLTAGQFTSAVSVSAANQLRDAYGDSLKNCFYDSQALGDIKCPADAASGSYPAFATPVTLPIGFFTSRVSIAEANQLRDAYAATITYCFWRNTEQSSNCAAGALAPSSAVVPANSLISFASQADANSLALALATASKRCLFSNDAMTGQNNCGVGTTLLQTGSVPAGTIISESKAAANALAQTLANALNVCASNSALGGVATPGSQGPAGNCTNPCGAFYS